MHAALLLLHVAVLQASAGDIQQRVGKGSVMIVL